MKFRIRILSLISAVASVGVAVACAFVATESVATLNASPDKAGDAFLLMKDARTRAIVGIFGLAISVALILLAAAKCYYYVKVSSGDDEFYRARRSGIIFFACTSLIGSASFAGMAASGSFASFAVSFVSLSVCYAVCAASSVTELIVFSIRAASRRRAEPVRVCTNAEIKRELDSESVPPENP